MERKVPFLLYKHPVRHQERGVCCRSTFRDAWTRPAARSGDGLVYVSEQRNGEFTIWGDPKRTWLSKDTVEWTWISRWSFLSLPKGIKWYLWGGGLPTAVLWKLAPSRSVRWVKQLDLLTVVLGRQWTLFEAFLWTPVSASYLQDDQGRPKDQVEQGGRSRGVISPDGAAVGRDVLNTHGLPGLAACTEAHSLQKLRIGCPRVFSIVRFCKTAPL